jgi:hypothetical protein
MDLEGEIVFERLQSRLMEEEIAQQLLARCAELRPLLPGEQGICFRGICQHEAGAVGDDRLVEDQIGFRRFVVQLLAKRLHQVGEGIVEVVVERLFLRGTHRESLDAVAIVHRAGHDRREVPRLDRQEGEAGIDEHATDPGVLEEQAMVAEGVHFGALVAGGKDCLLRRVAPEQAREPADHHARQHRVVVIVRGLGAERLAHRIAQVIPGDRLLVHRERMRMRIDHG